MWLHLWYTSCMWLAGNIAAVQTGALYMLLTLCGTMHPPPLRPHSVRRSVVGHHTNTTKQLPCHKVYSYQSFLQLCRWFAPFVLAVACCWWVFWFSCPPVDTLWMWRPTVVTHGPLLTDAECLGLLHHLSLSHTLSHTLTLSVTLPHPLTLSLLLCRSTLAACPGWRFHSKMTSCAVCCHASST